MATKKDPKSKAPAAAKPAAAKAKDLPAKKNAKGGARGDGWGSNNHNETLA
jgi:tricorn protease-like protein